MRVAVTEPRRLAAVTVAERVATERGEKVGRWVFAELLLSNSFTRWEEQRATRSGLRAASPPRLASPSAPTASSYAA